MGLGVEKLQDLRFLRGEVGEKPLSKLTGNREWQGTHLSIGCINGHAIIDTNAMRVHNIVIWDNMGWGAGNHSRLEVGFVTVFHDVKRRTS